MNRRTIAIDLAKDIFELALDGATAAERQRLSRAKFLRISAHRDRSFR